MIETAGDDRLSLMIARLSAQKAYIDHAVQAISDLPGFVLEVGLGKGRTFDRLRHCLPQRRIFVFDRFVHCPLALRPPAQRLFLGEFTQTLPQALSQLGRGAALVHADVGTEDRRADAQLASALAPLLERFMVPGGVLISDRPLSAPGLRPMGLPSLPNEPRWEYHMAIREPLCDMDPGQ